MELMKSRIEIAIWKTRKQTNKYINNNHQIRTAKRKKNPKNEDSVRSLWDNFKCANICIMEVLEGEKREQEIKNPLKK